MVDFDLSANEFHQETSTTFHALSTVPYECMRHVFSLFSIKCVSAFEQTLVPEKLAVRCAYSIQCMESMNKRKWPNMNHFRSDTW